MSELLILVDEHDREIGVGEKLAVHRSGQLHRAFSIFVVNPQGELLLQQRAWDKYHSGGLWTNTCCSHPRPGELVLEAAHRRLQEEMGFDCELVELFSFIYYAELDGGLIEHEYDHVLLGKFAGVPQVNPLEVVAWRWIDAKKLEEEIRNYPDRFTYWLRQCYPQFLSYL
ncbi:MAG: isopentenyl-diphosphate Delta-isomerase [Pseudanabaenaceae cyanobacterium SKYGB_i_bin29]|nr:isopentenyl-diphosphate Delta-isomerase [Pseudanabaenaceae cyanobacterium SKYG29]MDW8420893.1 isopentenyl-diphosphate Delta-isomerase [Pseudanabaenaceae cyanobacterium SKYGB_i_bin29]